MLEEWDVLETAYIELKDCREGQPTSLATSQVKSVLSGLSAKRVAKIQQSRTFKVQFNPAKLSFTAGGQTETLEKKSLTKKENGSVDECNITDEYKPLRMRAELVFDRSIYVDSSVQPEVEGFLAIAKNPYIRQVSFHWGKQSYSGKISEMSVKYTMFNRVGIPIRAEMDFCMDIY